MIELSESAVESLAAAALGVESTFDVTPLPEGERYTTLKGQGYATLLEILRAIDVPTSDLREAAEQGIYEFLRGQSAYLRRRIQEWLKEPEQIK